MKIGNRKIKTSSGKIITFKSKKKRENWERVAQAVKHGWAPKKRRKKK